MRNMEKFWLWMAFFILLSVAFVSWAKSQELVPEMLVGHSLAYQKNVAPQEDLGKLFSRMAIGGESTRLNPCIEVEANALRYCTPHAIQLLLHENTFVSVEEQLLKKFLSGNRPCDDTAEYIGRVCQLENFKMILKHFALKK